MQQFKYNSASTTFSSRHFKKKKIIFCEFFYAGGGYLTSVYKNSCRQSHFKDIPNSGYVSLPTLIYRHAFGPTLEGQASQVVIVRPSSWTRFLRLTVNVSGANLLKCVAVL